MKMKVKLDQKAVVDFLLRHVEKLVMCGIVFCFLGLAFGAVVRPKYTNKPDNLLDAAKRADDHIKATPRDRDKHKVVDYAAIAERSQKPLEDKPYALAIILDPPLFAKPIKRPKPPTFPVEQLRGTAGLGAFNFRAEAAPAGGTGQAAPGTGATVGQRWIVITGVVPLAKQAEAYDQCFKGNREETDVPEYYHCWVERADVTSAGDEAEPKWTPVNVMAARSIEKRWASPLPELVNEQFVRDRLVFPLGPLVGRPWGDEVAHLPEIPLGTVTPEAAPEEPAKPTPSPTQQPDLPTTDLPPAPPAARPQAGAGRREGEPAEREEESAEPGKKKPAGKAAGPAGMQYVLFRFFDFDVQPGRAYQYRVKLLLKNPNYGLEIRRLESADLAKDPWIANLNWSEPSAPIQVPRDDRLRVVSVKPPSRSEPVATVEALKWLHGQGVQVSEQFQAVRGQLLNFIAGGQGTPGSRGKAGKPTGPAVNFETGLLLLDMRGGERFRDRDRGSVEPGEVLLLDQDGSLTVKSELDQREPWDRTPEGAGTPTGPEAMEGPGPAQPGILLEQPEPAPGKKSKR